MERLSGHSLSKRLCALGAVLVTVAAFGCGRSAKPKPPRAAAVPSANAAKAKTVPQRRAPIEPTQVAFAARAPLLIAYGPPVEVWNTRTWKLERSIAVPPLQSGYMNTKPVDISPDGTVVAYIDANGRVTLWSVKSGALVRTLPQPVGLPMAVVWSPDGRYVAGGGDVVRLWDARTGRVVRTFRGSGDVAFSRDGKQLATAGSTSSAHLHAYLFDVATGRRIRSFDDQSGTDCPVAISPDARLVATGGEDPNWDPGPLPKDEEGRTYAPSEAFYAHDLKIKIWDTRTGQLVRMLPGHSNTDGTGVLQFAPDGKALLSAGVPYAALWDLRTGKARREFHTNGAGAISPDGRMVAVADPGLVVLDARTGRKLFSPK